ncbi:hypothetical protein [Dissulfurispira sp.]
MLSPRITGLTAYTQNRIINSIPTSLSQKIQKWKSVDFLL